MSHKPIITSIDLFGINGFSPAISGMVESLYCKIQVPVFSRTYVEENSIFKEFFFQECCNMSIQCVMRDLYKEWLMIGESHLDDKFPDILAEDFNINYHPVAVLDINKSPEGREKSLVITYGDFKFYIMNGDEIKPVKISADLKSKLFIKLNYRRERGDNGDIISTPIVLKILTTSGWNKASIDKFESIAPFDTKNHSINVAYSSREYDQLYMCRPPFLLFKTPIDVEGGVLKECQFLPPNIVTLASKKEDRFPCTTIIKVQNFYLEGEKEKIIPYIKFVVKTCIKLCIETVKSIEIGTQYKDEESLPEKYRGLIRFICLHRELIKNNKYEMPWDAIIEEEHKVLAIAALEDLFTMIG